MAADAGASGGAQVQYLEELEGWVLDERKVVTFRWLALVLSVTANAAKKMLYDFCQKQGERKVSAIYLVMGRGRATGGAGPMEVKLVSGEALDDTRKSFSEVSSVHVYSVQPASASRPADLSAQLWATDSEHSKEMLAGNTDAGANLRTHRLSGVHCPGIVDVPLPAASTQPDHVKEESIFDHAGDTGRGSAAAAAGREKSSAAADKPKGKAIAPTDFFAAAAIAGGKGKGKGKTKVNAREEKGGEANKSAPGGGISSFFSKAPPSKKGGVAKEELDLADPDKKTNKIKKGGESRDRGAKGADALAKVKKEGEFRGKDAEGADAPASASERDKTSCGAGVLQETVDAKCAGEGEKPKVNGPSTKKKPRLSKVVEEDDEEDDEICSGRGGEVGQRRKGIAKSGEDKDYSEDEEEWNDGGGAGSSSGKKAAHVSTAANGGGSLRKSTTMKSSNPGERVENGGKESVECNTSKNRTAPAPRDKKSRRREASGKGGTGDVGESSTERSEKRTKARATASGGGDEGGANEEESKLPRGKDKAKEGVKRKGRYESDGEDPEEGKPPVSGAMDKFTARPEGTGGGVAKRTKIVLKTRTYMDGGYMKSVNEEVEVTDDEEEPLRPAHTNKTRTSPPDDKTIKNGAENKAGGTDAPGVKGSGKTKKKSRAKPSGKQSSMTSFFNKA